MYYNIKNQMIIPQVPKNLIREDGSIWINFNNNDIDTLADNNYYTIRNDNNEPPTNNSIEIQSEQEIILDKPYADIIRKWLDPSHKNDIPTPPAQDPIIYEEA
jgi:hypothetical protein